MSVDCEVIIVGGGLAGLCCAIHLTKVGRKVILIEKNKYPFHKVCGEYVSNEVVPYLNWLGVDTIDLNAEIINKLSLTTNNGKKVDTALPLGGFGISRYVLDNFLYERAIKQGCLIIEDNVTKITFERGKHSVNTQNKGAYFSDILIGAYGKRSSLDKTLARKFIDKKSGWLAVKGHYRGFSEAHAVSLHHFEGGYCGVSRVEDGIINICYLSSFATFKKYKNIDEHRSKVLFKNAALKKIFETTEPVFDKPLSISQIFFDKKEIVHNHILMVGDTAGLIHPFCGNGMAMAIHSAAISANLVDRYFSGGITSRLELEQKYTKEWRMNFDNRLRMGKRFANLLQFKFSSWLILRVITTFPRLLKILIKQTHGQPISVASL